MNDPQVSLVFALHSNPGGYAVLVGSGVSGGTGIPTGCRCCWPQPSRLVGNQHKWDRSGPEKIITMKSQF